MACLTVYLKCTEQDDASMLHRYGNLIETMTNSSSISVLLGEDPPQGCCVQTVSTKCESHLMLKVRSYLWFCFVCFPHQKNVIFKYIVLLTTVMLILSSMALGFLRLPMFSSAKCIFSIYHCWYQEYYKLFHISNGGSKGSALPSAGNGLVMSSTHVNKSSSQSLHRLH